MNCVQTPSAFKNSNISSLATPEPHYIPGYAGYVPQSKYRPGHTYGMTSHRVLIDPCIHMSPRTILNNIHPEYCTDEFGRPGIGIDPLLSAQMALVNSRVNSLGRQQYQPDMTPGYTGFIPRYQSILGHTYSPACNRALARFEQDQWRDRLFNKELEALDGWRFCYKTKPWESPEVMRPVNTDLQQFSRPPPNQNSATFSPNFIPTKGAATGCSSCGGSPRSEFSILSPGRDLCEYGKRRLWGAANENTMSRTCGDIIPKLNAHRFTHPIERVQEIYRHCEGMLPNYQGHVPSAQFRIGLTFGSATRNAKYGLQPSRAAPVCYPLN